METKTIYTASSVDDNYAMPFAAMLASVLDNLACGYAIDIFVIDGGLSEVNKTRITESFYQKPVKFYWLYPRKEAFSHIYPRAHISRAAYYKILIFNLIPSPVKKIIFLDSDLIVRRDILQLWNVDFKTEILYAVQDQSIPFIDATVGSKNYYKIEPFLESPVGIKNYKEIGILPGNKYFNTGVLVVNTKLWRQENIQSKIIDFLNQNTEHNQCFDQDGFNAILFNRWGELDLRWNQISYFHRYPSWEKSPFDRQAFHNLKYDPYIIHFVAGGKPWFFGNKHISRYLFFEYLDKTAWKGWRPNLASTLVIKLSLRIRNLINIIREKKRHREIKDLKGLFLFCRDVSLHIATSALHTIKRKIKRTFSRL